MFIRLLLVMSLTGLLFACSNQVKETEPATVEDLTSELPATNATGEGGPQTYGADDGSTSEFSQLDDPQSPLSIRVIYFQYNSSEISSEYRSAIEAHSAYLTRNPGTSITLEGHADERGSREFNLALGERRAQGIKRQMLILGTSSAQIRLVSYGEERPAIDGHDESSWRQNRRVEILY